MSIFNIKKETLQKLQDTPLTPINEVINGTHCVLSIGIPNYKSKIIAHYHEYNLKNTCQITQTPFNFQHLVLTCTFHQPTELQLHDSEMKMNDSMRLATSMFGSCIIRNAYLTNEHRDFGHRNRFPNLNFHRDRNPAQDTHFSFFTRNPFDEEQKFPRKSSTLIIPNIVAHLQKAKETNLPFGRDGTMATYTLFENDNITDLFSKIIYNQAWDQPEDVGEICSIDNATVLHASYYPTNEKGYRIGVRYLS